MPDRPVRPGPPAVVALLGAVVAAQIAYPLTSGGVRDSLTVSIVCVAAAATLVHAATTRGTRVLTVLAAACVGGGFVVEVIGVHTGVPFGAYGYGTSLGPRVLGVPLVIALAWLMLAWPAALAARRLCRTLAARVVVGAWALAAWDLYLDPQMVAAGHWRWQRPDPHLPGVPGVPLSDYAGWLAVALAISLAIQLAIRDSGDADDRAPLAFYVWTWASSALALGAFLGLGPAAVWGAVAMGAVAVPVAVDLVRAEARDPVGAR